MAKHPIQPLAFDEHGVLRFKENKIVSHLIDHGSIDLNQIAVMDFDKEDREQLAQLIGYSLSGFGDLGYVSDETFNAAVIMHERGVTADEARSIQREEVINMLKEKLREPIAELYGIHPDDLNRE